MQLYLVPCTCGEQLRVRASQAGEQLGCKCGAAVSVPTIRGLKQLPMVDDEVAGPAALPMWQGPAFAIGAILLFAGCVVLAGNEFFQPAELKMDAQHASLTDEEIARAKIPTSEMGMDDLYEEYITLRTKGRNEYTQVVQAQIDAARKRYRLRRTIGGVLTLVGALLTIVGLVPLLGKQANKEKADTR